MTASSDPFESPKLLLERAQENVSEFHLAGKAFFDGKPHADVVEFDADTGEDVYKVRFTARLPSRLVPIVADALNNMRAALEQMLCISSQQLGTTNVKDMGFPFATSESGLETAIKAKCKNVPPEIVALVRTLKPYKGGNDALWAISRISAGNRHRMLKPVATAATKNFTVRHLSGNRLSLLVPKWDSAKQELVFARVPQGEGLQYDMEFEFYIAFGDVEVVAGQPVGPVLVRLGQETASVMNAIRTETERLLPNRR